MDLGVRDRTFIVVGGSSGMGLATAEVLATEGAHLVLIARNKSRLEDAGERLRTAHGVNVDVVPSDEDVQTAVAVGVDHHGPVRGLAVTAGPMEAPPGDMLHLGDDAWTYYFQHHVMLTVHACRTVIAHLTETGGGTIVTTAAYSIRAQKPTLIHYTAMKSAVASVTKNIAKTYGAHGIRANCVCPGMIDTPLLTIDRQAIAAEYGTDEQSALNRYAAEKWGLHVALGRIGRPREVGELIAFLLSDRAGYLTGATINIDGGTDF